MNTTPETSHPRRSRRTLSVLTNLALAAALSGLTASASAAAAAWEITATLISSPDYSPPAMHDINDSRIIVGVYTEGTPDMCYWSKAGSDTGHFELSDDSFPIIGIEQLATGINNSGIVSGIFYEEYEESEDDIRRVPHAVYWKLSAEGPDAGHDLGRGSSIGVNNNGHIFGYNSNNIWGYWDTNANDTWHDWAVSSDYYKTTAVASLNITGNSSLYLRDINDSNETAGYVTGQIDGKQQTHAGYWNAEGEFVDLGPGEAYGINNNGMIVGKDNNNDATVWISKDGFDTWETVNLEDLAEEVPALISGSGFLSVKLLQVMAGLGINDNNEIIANSYGSYYWGVDEPLEYWTLGFVLKLTAVAVPEAGATGAVAGVAAMLAACAAMRRRQRGRGCF
ncbi:MAG: hypothetical protein LBK99_00305 [Opitutaceae bacterium]|jgi:hypothetical protein|nr:hypothetical protein [Opitutaceae bacterium]